MRPVNFLVKALVLLMVVGCTDGCYHRQPRHEATMAERIANITNNSTAHRPIVMTTQVRWQIATSQKQFFQQYAYPNRRIVALFGAESCRPCHDARDWWMTQVAPNMPFVYWEDLNETRPEDKNSAGDVGAPMYAARHPNAKSAHYPLCAIIEGARYGAPFTQVVKWSGMGYEECTTGLQQALNQGL